MPANLRTLAPPALLSLLALAGARPAAAAEPFGDAVYYAGDLHAHTGYSGDGGSADLGNCEGTCGDFSDLFPTAQANGLDFVAITDHVNGNAALSAAEFAILNAAVLAANDPANGFVTIPAGEVWFTLRGSGVRLGHKTLLMFGDDATLAGLTLADVRTGSTSAVNACEDIWTWMDALTTGFGPAVLLPHHPSVRMPMATDWSCHDVTYEPAVEIYSEHGNGLDATSYDVPGEGIYDTATTLAALDPDGFALMFGFVGGTDSHDSMPGGVCDTDTEQPTHLYGGGLTMAVLDASESFDRDTLHEAIVERRTYVTSGPALPMAVQWSAGGTVLGGLGAALYAPASYDLDVSVSVPADRATHVTAVDLVGPDVTWSLADDGAGNWTTAVPAGDVPEWLYVAVEIDGASWYGSGGCDDGGDSVEWLWGSPSPIALWEDDADADGVSVLADDCDDDDATIFPGATETWYDGVDQDCDRRDDYDQDADGGRALAWGDDCDDTDASVYAGAPDPWYDGLDQDCDAADDYDQDRDGQQVLGTGVDCDDTDATVYVGAAEGWYDGVDQDCDGASDWDQDRDGDEAAPRGADCDDLDGAVLTGAPEIWYDGVDQDCDAADDYDQDGDGGRALGWGDDCDDTDATMYAGAPDPSYDGIDQDCDTEDDYDQDGDGQRAWGFGLDCDDADPAIYLGAPEVWYDGVDQDCAGASDYDQDGDGDDATPWGGDDCDDVDADAYVGAPEIWYDGIDQGCDGGSDYDRDGDGYDALPLGGTDCNDTRADVSPAAADPWYDGLDQDCDGLSDYDQDGDSFDALSAGGPDCDDTDPDVSPLAAESWYDGIDQDCDGASDWDADQDGADAAEWDGTDCDDTRDDVSPAAVEIWYDGFDQDCDDTSDFDQDGDGIGIPHDCHDTDPRAWACDATQAPPPGGCAVVPGGSAAWGAVLLAGMSLARRRSRR